jgi:simple sugar transport system permease protein
VVLGRREGSVIIGLISIYALGLINDPGTFLTLRQVNNILRDAAPFAVIGYGVALLMITAEFDLSVGSLYGLTGGMILVMMTELGINGPFAIFVVIVFGVLYGVTQGLLVTQLKLPSLIVTIGTLTAVRGLLQIIIGNTTVTVLRANVGVLWYFGGDIILSDLPVLGEEGFQYQLPFVHDSVQSFNRVSMMILWAFVFLVLFHYLLFYTRFGYHVRATGDNVESAGTTGIDPEIVKIGCFGIVGLVTAFAGAMNAGYARSIQGSTGDGAALIVIAAVVLGGTKLTGGEGTMIGVMLGAVVLEVANKVLNSLGLGISGWSSVITGGFIVAAVGLDVLFRGFSTDLIRQWYVEPSKAILRSPSEFFRKRVEPKTSSDMYGYLMLSIGATAILTNVLAWFLGLEVDSIGPLPGFSVQSLFGLDISGFKLVFNGNWPETMAQVYLFLLLIALGSFLVIEVFTRLVESAGDYEGTLGATCYSMLVAPVLSIPIVVYGFDIFFVGGELVSALIVAAPVFLGMLWLMYVGTVELHDLSEGKAAGAVASVVLAALLLAGVVGLSLTGL